jgi:hypothetical protein
MKEIARRPSALTRFLSLFMVAVFLIAETATASGQTDASVRYDMPT